MFYRHNLCVVFERPGELLLKNDKKVPPETFTHDHIVRYFIIEFLTHHICF